MAGFGNYSLVINSKFDPLSFQDMVAPYLMYKQEYDTQQSALSELQTKASVWENMANKETDPKAYAQYKDYADSLWQQADNLASSGLNAGTRTALMNLKARYSSDITPIENAYNRREKLKEEQRQGKSKGLIYDYDAATTSLDKFVFDNQKDYDTIDLNTLYTKSSQTFGNLAKELVAYGSGRPVDDYTNTFVQHHGITKEEARAFAEGIRNRNLDSNNKVFNALKAPYDSLYNGTNVGKWDNEDAKRQVTNTILAGMESAIGQTNVSTVDNYGARLNAKALYGNGSGSGDDQDQIQNYNKRNIYTAQEINDNEAKKKAYEYLRNNKYLAKGSNGHWTINENGRKQYAIDINRSRVQNSPSSITGGGAPSGVSSELVNAIRALHLEKAASKDKTGPWQNSQVEFAKNLCENSSSQYDAKRSTEFYRTVDSNSWDDFLNAWNGQAVNGRFSNYGWKTTNIEGINAPTLEKIKDNVKIPTRDEIKSMEVVTGKHGDYFHIKTTGDDEYRIPVKDIFGDYEPIPFNYSNSSYGINNFIDQNLDDIIRKFGASQPKTRNVEQ